MLQASHPQAIYEAKVLKILFHPQAGIPRVHWYGSDGDFNLVVMDLLGASLESLFEFCKKRFSLKVRVLFGFVLIALDGSDAGGSDDHAYRVRSHEELRAS